MAILQRYREYHFNATEKVSQNTRSLALAAIAIVWLFKVQTGSQYLVPAGLKWPLYLSILALSFDFFQHFISSIVWHILFRRKEKELEEGKITEETELYVSEWYNVPPYFFYYVKVIILFFTYLMLAVNFPKVLGWM